MELKDIKDESINTYEFGMVFNQTCNYVSTAGWKCKKDLDYETAFEGIFDYFMEMLIKNKKRYESKFERFHTPLDNTTKEESVKNDPKIELDMDF